MAKELKIFFLAIALPAVFLTAGGIRFVMLEGARARATTIAALDSKARAIAKSAVETMDANQHPERKPAVPRMMRHGERPSGRHGGSPPRARHEWLHGKGSETCRRHELPPEVRDAVLAAIKKELDDPGVPFPLVAEVRHSCSRVSVAGEEPVTGSLAGIAPLSPRFPDFAVCVAPKGGDAAAAGGIRRQAVTASILFLLLCAALASGAWILFANARKARIEARRKTDFVSNVSHELKTPLTSMAMFSEMLASGKLDQASSSAAAKNILAQSKKLARLIDGLLEFSRLERSARVFKKETVDLKAMAREAVETAGPSFPEGIEAVLDPGPVTAVADGEAVLRILDCLVENAGKYAALVGKVEVRARMESGKAVVEVADRGPGVPPHFREKVFERFWRADNSVTRTVGGTGLGLAIARDLADGMGARLSCRGREGGGAVFALEFPREETKEDGNG